MKVLVLGAAGMVGSACCRMLSRAAHLQVIGTIHSFSPHAGENLSKLVELVAGVDAADFPTLERVFADARPAIVVNCIGVIKQLKEANDPLIAIEINALFPHRLAALCRRAGARLVHISTDCVFNGKRGNYAESDGSDADDLYGRTKFLGEVDYGDAITLRTSVIGHELGRSESLLEWFLKQQVSVKGYTRAIFSGLTTNELAVVIRDYVMPRPSLAGLYHVAGEPIAKFDLLRLIAQVYKKQIEIMPSDEIVIDRSLNGSRFRAATGYFPPRWPALVETMFELGRPLEL